MTENKDKKLNIAIIGGGRSAGKMMKAQLDLYEELESYRAIGTVEDLQDVYELCESLEEAVKVGNALVEELKKYQSIGTIDEFKALKEKNEPKKAIGKRQYDEAYCPACNEVISDGEFWALDEYVHHCNYCGQAVKGVDWSE